MSMFCIEFVFKTQNREFVNSDKFNTLKLISESIDGRFGIDQFTLHVCVQYTYNVKHKVSYSTLKLNSSVYCNEQYTGTVQTNCNAVNWF